MTNINPNAESYAHKLRMRVCGICIQNNQLLLIRHQQTINNTEFWAPPGGGLNYGESIHACLIREFLEETGLDVQVNRFLFVNEFKEAPLHAVELFFEVQIVGGNIVTGSDPETATDKQLIEEVKFKSLEEINSIPVQDKHRVLHYLFSLDDLLGMENIFLQ